MPSRLEARLSEIGITLPPPGAPGGNYVPFVGVGELAFMAGQVAREAGKMKYTGKVGRDVTVEAHREVYEKEIEAFGTVFTIVSMQKIGTSAVQSRATGGVAGGTYLFALPGSPGACRDAWDEILKPQLDSRHRPCNFVEIMPRLDEHLRRK